MSNDLTEEDLEASYYLTPLTGQAAVDLDLIYGDSVGPWKHVKSSESTYEGDCTTTHVFKHEPSETYWQFQYHSNSWSEVYDEAGDIHPYEVEPYEVTVTKYKAKK